MSSEVFTDSESFANNLLRCGSSKRSNADVKIFTISGISSAFIELKSETSFSAVNDVATTRKASAQMRLNLASLAFKYAFSKSGSASEQARNFAATTPISSEFRTEAIIHPPRFWSMPMPEQNL